ncbi:MAG: MarR family transcriptional regulator [Lysobacter sp.]|nr:MarR family transcriptional regulator [Lysobacter sp.]
MSAAKSNPQVVLRPQDLLVVLRLALSREPAPSYAALAAELGLTASATHAGVARAVQAQLARKDQDGKPQAVREALRLFLQHGARYCFPATRGGLTRGWPTGYAAEPLRASILQPNEPPPVWPDKAGPVRGVAFHPLYPSVPHAIAQNPALYELLALFDAVRGGSPRERALALPLLEQRLAMNPNDSNIVLLGLGKPDLKGSVLHSGEMLSPAVPPEDWEANP